MPTSETIVVLRRNKATACTVNLFGGTIVSWVVDGREQLYLSQECLFDMKTPIKGGIPFVFPRFGVWESGPPNGFCRIMRWKIEKCPKTLPNGDVVAVFSCRDNEWTRSMWNYAFSITYYLKLTMRELVCTARVNNNCDLPIRFDLVFLAHFRVLHPKIANRSALYDNMYIDAKGVKTDTINKFQKIHESGTKIFTTPGHCLLSLDAFNSILVQRINLPDTTVWFPWEADHPEIPEYELSKTVRVATGTFTRTVDLSPGEVFEGRHTLRVIDPTDFFEIEK